jgi:hypothetical protein
MKVNLYYAPFPSQIFKGDDFPVNTERPLNPKSALVTLATGIRMHARAMDFDCEIEIIDMQVGGGRIWYKTIAYGPRQLDCFRLGIPFESIEDKIREGDIHGITCNYTNSAQIVADLAAHIKSVSPHSLVVVGGVDATARPEYYLRRGADLVVKGEGEYTFSAIIKAWAEGGDFEAIGNVCTPANPNPKQDMRRVIDLDTLEPMALDLIPDLSIYTDTAEGPPPTGVKSNYICWETSRGCAWACSFCTAPSRGKFRFMAPAAVARHFDFFRARGINTIVWQEDNPLSRIQQNASGAHVHDRGRAEVLEIFRMARDYGFSWEFANGIEFCKFKANGSFDHELADALLWNDRAPDGSFRGCYRVQIPLDNLNLEEKSRFPKLLTFDEQLEILASMLIDYRVAHQTYDLFIGYPEHDERVLDRFTDGCLRIKQTLSSLSPDYVSYFNVFNLALLPGARDYVRLKHLLAFDIDADPEVIAIFLSAINTDHFTYWDIYRKRVAMTNLLNDPEQVRIYDGIYTGGAASIRQPAMAGAVLCA